MKHEHIGDAFFDVDAAEFLLGELQHQQQQQQQQQVRPDPAAQPTQSDGTQQQQQQQQPQERQEPPLQQQGSHSGQSAGHGVVKGHAAGPKWIDSLPKGRLPANVRLERHALVSLSHVGCWWGVKDAGVKGGMRAERAYDASKHKRSLRTQHLARVTLH
jgi:hypothetical protein